MINIRNLDPNKIKANEKSYRNCLIYYIRYLTVKDLSYTTINNVNPLHLIINRLNACIEESNGNRYLTLVPIDESKNTIKMHEGLFKSVTLGMQFDYKENSQKRNHCGNRCQRCKTGKNQYFVFTFQKTFTKAFTFPKDIC